MQALYAFTVGGFSLEHVLDTIIKPELRDDGIGRDFAERLFLRTADNRERTDEIIRDHISNWEIGRLAVVDRVILQMAITEMLTFEDIPTKVTINEAIEIAKKYSTSGSGPFVNGILDAVVLTLHNDGVLNKQGRGLVDLPARKRKSRKRDGIDADRPADPGAHDTGPGQDTPESGGFDATDLPESHEAAENNAPETSDAPDASDAPGPEKKGPKKPRIKRPLKKKKNP